MFKYGEMSLDRASNQRKDPEWLLSQKHNGSRWVLTYSDQNYFSKDDNSPLFLPLEAVQQLDLDCSGQPFPDSKLSRFSASAGGNPSLC